MDAYYFKHVTTCKVVHYLRVNAENCDLAEIAASTGPIEHILDKESVELLYKQEEDKSSLLACAHAEIKAAVKKYVRDIVAPSYQDIDIDALSAKVLDSILKTHL